jgi:hypothetical protein
MKLLIALFGILAYIDSVRSGFRTRSTFGWVGGAKVPTFQAVIYFLIIWTAVSVPLGLLLAAVIKFGAGEELPPDQTDQEFGPPASEARDSVVAEKRTMATILFLRNKTARQSQESVSSSGASPLADQEVKTALTERAHRQIG